MPPQLKQQLWLIPIIAFTALGIWFALDGRVGTALVFFVLALLNVGSRYLSVKAAQQSPPR